MLEINNNDSPEMAKSKAQVNLEFFKSMCNEHKNIVQKYKNRVDKELLDISGMVLDSEEQEMLDELKDAANEFKDAMDRELAIHTQEVDQWMNEMQKEINKI